MKFDFSKIQVPKGDWNGSVYIYSNPPWQMNACLNFSHDMTHGYVEGYRKAAEALIERLSESHRGIDYLVYPIIFLTRHHLELRLKEILTLMFKSGERKMPCPRGHNLKQLWCESRAVLVRMIPEEDMQWIPFIGQCVDKFMEVDAGSDAFRYPTTGTGDRSLSDITNINLSQFYSVFAYALDWLECVAVQLQYNYDYINENASQW